MNSLILSRRNLLRILPTYALHWPLFTFGAPETMPEESFAAVERGIGFRLGVAALDTGTGRRLEYRAAELFAMCSTFKFLLAACILKGVDAGNEDLKRPISYTQEDLLEYAPITRAHVKRGAMTVGDLCAAAITVSDNTAANLLLAQIGGPEGLTTFIRSLGNHVTRLDRKEPQLNEATRGDPRDTTSPAAMVDSMRKLLLGDGLSAPSRGRLASWLEQSTTGGNRLRAGMPRDWRAGDKTGTGDNGAIGDIGIFSPPNKPPILIAAYAMEGKAAREAREQAIAAVGRIVSQRL
jgi:beta-lactamase class A